MFENLTDKLERSFKILKGEGRITEINIAETLKEIRRALIDADVNYKVAKSFTDEVKQKALGQNVLTAVKPGQMSGPAIVNILQPIPNTCPSFLYSIAGEAILFANPVIGTSAPAPPKDVISGYIPKPVNITLKATSISVV